MSDSNFKYKEFVRLKPSDQVVSPFNPNSLVGVLQMIERLRGECVEYWNEHDTLEERMVETENRFHDYHDQQKEWFTAVSSNVEERLDYLEGLVTCMSRDIANLREKEKTPELKGKNHYWIDPDLIAAIHNKISSKEEEVLREPNVA
jgi:hypothetical protein